MHGLKINAINQFVLFFFMERIIKLAGMLVKHKEESMH